jgi:glycosyltransferase involved in cell wall biosynthesis
MASQAGRLHVLIFYRHFAKFVPDMSHCGLGNNAIFTAKVLKTVGIRATPVGVYTRDDVIKAMTLYPDATHGIIEAIWLSPSDIRYLASAYPNVEWTCRNHSQIAFLQVEPQAIRNFRGYAEVQEGTLNFRISANNHRFCTGWLDSYGVHTLYLPNLYPHDIISHEKIARGGLRDTFRISAYGANRLLKNHTTAAQAALMIGRRTGQDIEFHINVNREPGGKEVVAAIKAMYHHVPHARLVEDPWTTWSDFRHMAASMDLGLCPTFTETFCLVAADHVAAGVPVVGTDAIEWLPQRWQASMDDPEDIAEIGINLLMNPHAGREGKQALKKFVKESTQHWTHWLIETGLTESAASLQFQL